MNHLKLAVALLGLMVAIIAFVRNQPHRNLINDALGDKLRIPERMWGYSAEDVQGVIDQLRSAPAIEGRSPLDVYVRPVLYWNDILFAVALAVFSASLWLWILGQVGPVGALRYALIAVTISAVVYGVADVAEDVMLARLFAQPKVSAGGTWVACQLTRIKIATNAGSITAGAVFLTLKYLTEHKAGAGD
jgi:hypothetical protein